MADYRIKVELLGSDERDVLKKFDVQLLASGISFKHKLSEKEMRVVAGILSSLKNRTNDEGNHIDFALGDWMLQADEWFGSDTGVRWMAEEVKRKAYRDHLLMLTGVTLIQLQCLESLIRGVCSWLHLKVKGKTLTVSDFLSPDPGRIRATLGDLKEALNVTHLFDSSFEIALNEFVKKRNRFVHSFWLETFKDSSGANPPSFDTLRDVEEFLSSLFREAVEMEAVFRGLHYSFGKQIGKSVSKAEDMSDDLFVEWSKYERAFLCVRNVSTECQKEPAESHND